MNQNESTSGFVMDPVGVETSLKEQGLELFYTSTSGFNQLYRYERFGRLHLLKALKPVYRGEEFYEQALHKEFSIGYTLEHPNICHTLGWEWVPDLGHCILLEYIDGLTLKDLIDSKNITQEQAYKWITELCEALQYLHSKQVIHRDLKPQNILITYNGSNCKLIDFGLSDCDDYEMLKMPAGTRYYLAPEALEEGLSLDLRADIYSLGVIIGELALLLNDKRLSRISYKCTQRKREKRYHSAKEVLEALHAPKKTWMKPLTVVLLMMNLLAFTLLLGNRIFVSPSEHSVVNAVLPFYGNLSGGEACRRILSEAKLQLPADSVELLKQLKDALNEEYPLPVQRKSKVYLQHWKSLQQEVSDLYKSH